VKRLLERGHAYEVGGNVYFDVASWPKYGRLSGRSVQEMQAGARVEVAADKRHPADFALWKRAEPGHIMQWPSPWGMGYPGWHLECSAMSMKYLGDSFDIHGGGMENQFPHHEDEIAQAEAATGKLFAKYWIHNNMVTVGGQKMGKSLGNFITLKDAFQKWDPMVLRLFILQSHYRSPLDFSDEALEAAAGGYERLTIAFDNLPRLAELAEDRDVTDTVPAGKWLGKPPTDTRLLADVEQARRKFCDAMDDDFGTPSALAALFELQGVVLRESLAAAIRPPNRSVVHELRGLFQEIATNALGLEFKTVADDRTQKTLSALVNILLRQRELARKAKDYATADAIRKQLDESGIVVEDTPDGPHWRQKRVVSLRLSGSHST
jgi:cysteinyl-tRNA synthetase